MSEEIQKLNKNEPKNSKTGKLDLLKINTKVLTESLNELSLPRLFYQLVVFVLDASESMTREGITGKSKGEEIHEQIAPIIQRLKASKNSKSFDVCMYAFSQEYKEFISLESVKDINIDNNNFNPCDYVGNYQTYAESALLDVEERVSNYLLKHKDKNCQAIIIFLGDGAIYDFPKAVKICNRLKSNTKVTMLSYLLEDKNWKNDLPSEKLKKLKINIKKLSSKDSQGINFFESKVNPEDIRKHMIKSISTVSKIV